MTREGAAAGGHHIFTPASLLSPQPSPIRAYEGGHLYAHSTRSPPLHHRSTPHPTANQDHTAPPQSAVQPAASRTARRATLRPSTHAAHATPRERDGNSCGSRNANSRRNAPTPRQCTPYGGGGARPRGSPRKLPRIIRTARRRNLPRRTDERKGPAATPGASADCARMRTRHDDGCREQQPVNHTIRGRTTRPSSTQPVSKRRPPSYRGIKLTHHPQTEK